MFAFLAPAGDLGCSSGPFLVGMVSDAAGGSLNKGIAAATVFHLLMLAGIMLCKHTAKRVKISKKKVRRPLLSVKPPKLTAISLHYYVNVILC